MFLITHRMLQKVFDCVVSVTRERDLVLNRNGGRDMAHLVLANTTAKIWSEGSSDGYHVGSP